MARCGVRDLTMAEHVSQALRITGAFTAFALGFLAIAFAADAPAYF